MPQPQASPHLHLSFGDHAPGGGRVLLPHQLLAGDASTSPLLLEPESSRHGGWVRVLGIESACGAPREALVRRQRLENFADLPELAQVWYRELFAHLEDSDLDLARMWNFVPAIHSEAGGLENYRLFNLGRARAFAEHFGPDDHARMPAATGIGTPGDELVLIALLDRSGLRHLENPRQVPAWKYPDQHGPQPPSFSRATISADKRTVWLAGTAAVVGHESRGETMAEQLHHTWDNIRELESLYPAGLKAVDFTAWVRHPHQASEVVESLERELPPACRTRVLQAEVCRRELLVEIEGIYCA